MALDSGDYRALVGVLVVLLALLMYTQLKARKAPTPHSEQAEDQSVDPLLSRFAHHEGDVVGETVAVDGDQLILKQAGVFKGVPLAQARLAGDEVQIHGAVDWSAAKEVGAKWLETNRAGADEVVAGPLTRSEDVRSPALEAFKRREAEATDSDSEE